MAKELNKFMLSAITIIGLTVVVLVGIAITAAFSRELRTETTILDVNTTVTTALEENGTATVLSAFPFLQSMSICSNSTSGDILPAANYTINEGTADGGTITLEDTSSEWEGVSLNCSSIVYLADSGGQAVADKFSDGLGIFGTFAVIIILAIVGKAIISLFRKKD